MTFQKFATVFQFIDTFSSLFSQTVYLVRYIQGNLENISIIIDINILVHSLLVAIIDE